MSLLVQKFGGTSVGTPERIHAVADQIYRVKKAGKQLIVVVSAMGQTTDDLLEKAYALSSDPPHREMDMLLSAGERISMALLSIALSQRGMDAVSFTGSQVGIITDTSHRRARIRRILGDRVREALEKNRIVIVAGFQGVSETKEITTLGRGGSDTTAVALAAGFQAQSCEIFTDVDGVFSADPRVVSQARCWERLSLEMAVELCTRGAGVLHPRSVQLARRFGVSLAVKNSLKDQSKGTLLMKREEMGMEEMGIVGVTGDSEKMPMKVEFSDPKALPRFWKRVGENHLMAVTPVFEGGILSCFVDRTEKGDWENLFKDEKVSVQFIEDQAPLSVVGECFSQDGSALPRLIEKLAENQISVTMGRGSPLAVTVAVPLQQLEQGVRILHREYLEK